MHRVCGNGHVVLSEGNAPTLQKQALIAAPPVTLVGGAFSWRRGQINPTVAL
jgi:hypothetical protein